MARIQSLDLELLYVMDETIKMKKKGGGSAKNDFFVCFRFYKKISFLAKGVYRVNKKIASTWKNHKAPSSKHIIVAYHRYDI